MLLHHTLSQRILKYLAFIIILYLSLTHIPSVKVDMYEILAIIFIGLTTFGLLDSFYPSVRIEQNKIDTKTE